MRFSVFIILVLSHAAAAYAKDCDKVFVRASEAWVDCMEKNEINDMIKKGNYKAAVIALDTRKINNSNCDNLYKKDSEEWSVCANKLKGAILGHSTQPKKVIWGLFSEGSWGYNFLLKNGVEPSTATQ